MSLMSEPTGLGAGLHGLAPASADSSETWLNQADPPRGVGESIEDIRPFTEANNLPTEGGLIEAAWGHLVEVPDGKAVSPDTEGPVGSHTSKGMSGQTDYEPVPTRTGAYRRDRVLTGTGGRFGSKSEVTASLTIRVEPSTGSHSQRSGHPPGWSGRVERLSRPREVDR